MNLFHKFLYKPKKYYCLIDLKIEAIISFWFIKEFLKFNYMIDPIFLIIKKPQINQNLSNYF